ncbi:hypothetical protein [Paracoccus sp. ME4]|uniref:hypothetical protein n=1 Tax=Paracoccus sp. ME4 TaxID=3138066 RepID=UPI00398B4C45
MGKAGIGIIGRIASIATGERPEERFARLTAAREPGLARMRDELVPAILKHRNDLDLPSTRHFDFEGGRLMVQTRYAHVAGRDVWKVQFDIRGADLGHVEFHMAALPRRDTVTMVSIIRPRGAFGEDTDRIREVLARAGGIVDRFASLYLSTRVEKWREMIHGEYAPGRDDIIHDRSTLPERWIPEVDEEIKDVSTAHRHATVGLNEGRLDAEDIERLRSRMEQLMVERRAMLEQHYRDLGRDMDMRPLPRQLPAADVGPDDAPKPG